MGWAGNVGRIGENIKRKTPLGRPRRRLDDKMDIRETYGVR